MAEKNQVETFREWIDTATAGQVFIYHTGYLARDRAAIIEWGYNNPLIIPNGDIDDLGKLALSAFQSGKVHLFQRKIHDDVYQYIAMKASEYRRQW